MRFGKIYSAILIGSATKPLFACWVWNRGITMRVFGKLFQVKFVSDEIFTQRHDAWRLRAFGLSVKMFGK